jgi:hypothetical protein
VFGPKAVSPWGSSGHFTKVYRASRWKDQGQEPSGKGLDFHLQLATDQRPASALKRIGSRRRRSACAASGLIADGLSSTRRGGSSLSEADVSSFLNKETESATGRHSSFATQN